LKSHVASFNEGHSTMPVGLVGDIKDSWGIVE